MTFVALVFLATGQLRNDTRASIAYLVEANAVVTQYRDLAQRFDMTTPVSTAAAGAALDIALSSWEEGLQSFTPGLFAVVDLVDGGDGVDELAAALASLRVGDLAYRQFLGAIDELSIDVPVEFPDLEFLPAELGSLRHTAGIVAVAESAPGMALRRDLEISAVKLDPQEVGTDDNGDLILPATESLVVRASVGNRGNQNESDIRVSVTLQGSDGAVLYQETSDLDGLDPRGSTTVDFSTLPVAAGERFTILVAVTVLPGDADTTNNVRQLQIRVNEPS